MLVFGGRLFHRGTYSRDRYFNDIDFENDRVPFLISQCQKSSRIAKLSSLRCLRDTLSLIAAIASDTFHAAPDGNANYSSWDYARLRTRSTLRGYSDPIKSRVLKLYATKSLLRLCRLETLSRTVGI